jgi:hypothetical protein
VNEFHSIESVCCVLEMQLQKVKSRCSRKFLDMCTWRTKGSAESKLYAGILGACLVLIGKESAEYFYVSYLTQF